MDGRASAFSGSIPRGTLSYSADLVHMVVFECAQLESTSLCGLLSPAAKASWTFECHRVVGFNESNSYETATRLWAEYACKGGHAIKRSIMRDIMRPCPKPRYLFNAAEVGKFEKHW